MCRVTIYVGEVRDVLVRIAETSFHAAIASPPHYWARRYRAPDLVYGGDSPCSHTWTERGEVWDWWIRLPVVPCTVLDPMAGSGTSAIEAVSLGRNAILIEVSPQYAEEAVQRIRRECGSAVEIEVIDLLRQGDPSACGDQMAA